MSDQPETSERHADHSNDPNQAHAPATEQSDARDKLAAMLPGLSMIAILVALVLWGLFDTR